MTYWKKVLNEFLHKDNIDCAFYYTNLRELQQKRGIARVNEPEQKYINKRYALGNNYPSIYFTYREAQCMKMFLEGRTCLEVGQYLSISPRTVEFYLVNMKKKLNCQTKIELIKKIIQSDFMNNLDF